MPIDPFKEQLSLHSKSINNLENKLTDLENFLPQQDQIINEILNKFNLTLKNLSYNQKTLENKFEDLLKNQLNSDQLINKLNKNFEILNESVNKLKHLKNSDLSNQHGFSLTETNNTNTTYRGPGRPKKYPSLSENLVTLPTGTVNISKNKKIFQDPNKPVCNKDIDSISPPISATSSAGNEIPRKRGRPPKKKNINLSTSTSPINSSNKRVFNENKTNFPELSSTKIINQRRKSTRTRREPNFYDEDNEEEKDNSILDESPNSVSDRDEDFECENKEYEDENISNGTFLSKHNDEVDSNSHIILTHDAINKTRRQLELERRRDPREKMLVSMKYSDRERAKHFMESNKDLLKAMKEEERKKRMSVINFEPPTVSTLQPPSTPNSVSLPSNQESAPQPTNSPTLSHTPKNALISNMPNPRPINVPPRKIGISSMLNNDDDTITPQKRKFPEIYNSNNDLPITLQPFSKHSTGSLSLSPDANNKRDLRDLIPMQPEKRDNRGRPATSSNGGDNSAALLMASPVELIYRDSYFYLRSDPSKPITVGTYLELKFRNKEEELIKLTLGEEDYAELTKQDRINAYFLKPEIDIETEFACQVLSNVTLTEKYVNSLEYFLMEFRWENRLVSLGLKLRESKRTWQRRKALFALFEFWRDKSKEKRGFPNFSILHAVKEMENYRVFINRSVSWFYNHITLLKMILFDLCDNTDTQWREWMFPKDSSLPTGADEGISKENINGVIDEMLTLDFLEDGTENMETKSSAA